MCCWDRLYSWMSKLGAGCRRGASVGIGRVFPKGDPKNGAGRSLRDRYLSTPPKTMAMITKAQAIKTKKINSPRGLASACSYRDAGEGAKGSVATCELLLNDG